ncbi:monooxygenase FAD-binding protein [Mycena floridula]|nr:monooxygenase FAD-binding protein [Mycena floridula]
MPEQKPLRVAIIGAGLGGLTLARILQHRKTPLQATESSVNARNQGGSLDLKKESGQVALHAAGLHAQFLELSHSSGEDTRIVNKHATKVFEEIQDPKSWLAGYNPEIDRTLLREMLLKDLEAEIHWNHKLVGVNPSGSAWDLEFSESRVNGVDVVVGADGAWSKVRASLYNGALPVYTGITFLDLTLSNPSPEIKETVPSGLFFAVDDHKGIIAQHNSNNVIRVYAAVQEDETWQRESDVAKASSPADLLLSTYFSDWDASLQNLVREADPNPTMRAIYAMSLDFIKNQDKPAGTAVLLGDAAHLMSPFAGEGVNLAMADAVDLADALASVCKSVKEIQKGMDERKGSASDVALEAAGHARLVLALERALNKYDKKMKKRALPCAVESKDNSNVVFGDDAAVELKKLFNSLFSVTNVVKLGWRLLSTKIGL